MFNLGRRDRGRRDLEHALALMRPDDPCRPFARTLLPLLDFVVGSGTDPEAGARELLAAVDEGTDPWWTARASCTVAQFLRMIDRPEQARTPCRRAADLWAWVEDTMGEALALEELALAELDDGRADEARATIGRAEALRETNGPWADPPHADLRRGTVLHDLGRAEDGHRAQAHGRERAILAGLPTTAYDAALGWVLVELGRHDEGLELLAGAERTYRAAGHAFNAALIEGQATLGRVLAGRRAELRDLGASVCEPPEHAPVAMRLVHGVLAAVAGRAGRRDEAVAHLRRWAPAAGTRLALARPLDAVFRHAAAGGPPPPDVGLPSAVYRMARACFVGRG